MYEYYLYNKALDKAINKVFKKKYVQKQLKAAFLSRKNVKFDSHHKDYRDDTKLVLTNNYSIGRRFVPSEKGWNIYAEVKPNVIKEYLVITVDSQTVCPSYKFVLHPAKIAKWDGEKFDVESGEDVIFYMSLPTVDTEEFFANCASCQE